MPYNVTNIFITYQQYFYNSCHAICADLLFLIFGAVMGGKGVGVLIGSLQLL